jgi:hypothetical protein
MKRAELHIAAPIDSPIVLCLTHRSPKVSLPTGSQPSVFLPCFDFADGVALLPDRHLLRRHVFRHVSAFRSFPPTLISMRRVVSASNPPLTGVLAISCRREATAESPFRQTRQARGRGIAYLDTVPHSRPVGQTATATSAVMADARQARGRHVEDCLPPRHVGGAGAPTLWSW